MSADWDPEPEEETLSSDLDWMLQSGQASRWALARALVGEYYLALYRLALSLLTDPGLARQAAVEIFSAALLDTYRYRSQDGVQTWLFRIALPACARLLRREKLRALAALPILRSRRVTQPPAGQPGPPSAPSTVTRPPVSEDETSLCRAVDALPEAARLPALLHYLLGWPAAQIAAIVAKDQLEVQAQLDFARQELSQALPEKTLPPEEVDLLLSAAMGKCWPAPGFSQAVAEQFVSAVLALAARRRARRQRFFALNESLLVAAAILLAAGLFWGYNRLFPEIEPTQVVPEARLSTAAPSPRQARRNQFRYTPVPPPTLAPFPEDAFYYVRPGESFGSIASRLDVPAVELRELNRAPAGGTPKAGSYLLIPGKIDLNREPAPTPVTPAPARPPLSRSSGPEEILRRIRQFDQSWNTLWLDARVTFYGPKAYLGPPQDYRLQAWASQDQVLFVAGPYTNHPAQVLLSSSGGSAYLARPGLNQPWLKELTPSFDDGDFMRVFLPFIRLYTESIILPFEVSQPGIDERSLRVVGSEPVAGRETLIVDWFSEAGIRLSRLWLDMLTGLVLRRQSFDLLSGEAVVSESQLTSVAFDADFPAELFDPRLPWRGGYARDPSGQPFDPGEDPAAISATPDPSDSMPISTRPPTQAAPTGFDVRRSILTFHSPPELQDPSGFIDSYVERGRLTFHYSKAFNLFDPQTFAMNYPVDLFAGETLLGRIRLPDPVSMLCTRSPDGRLLAFSPRSFYFDWSYFSLQPPFLRWLDLTTPEEMLYPHVPLQAYDFAFAPDSLRLAVFGSPENPASRGIYILDTHSLEYTLLFQAESATSLTWSPDGSELAFLMTKLEGGPVMEVVVMRLSDRAVTYRSFFDRASQQPRPTATPAPDWLPERWEVAGSTRFAGLDRCAAPPG